MSWFIKSNVLGWHRALFLSVLLFFHSWQTLCPQINQTVPSILRAYRAEAGAVTFLPRMCGILFKHSSSSYQLPGFAQPGEDSSCPRLPRSIQAEQAEDVPLEVSSAESRLRFLSFPGLQTQGPAQGSALTVCKSPGC